MPSKQKINREKVQAALNTIRPKCGYPRTVRGLFYHLVSLGLVAKNESEYQCTVARLCRDMRENGSLPWSWIADATRWMRRSDSYSGVNEFRERASAVYRRALWQDQGCYLEVWCEKATLAGLIMDVTDKWDVPLMCTGGFSSIGFLHSAAMQIAERGVPAHIYYLGDHDPSGLMIASTSKASCIATHLKPTSPLRS